jgi:hypothetical protein
LRLFRSNATVGKSDNGLAGIVSAVPGQARRKGFPGLQVGEARIGAHAPARKTLMPSGASRRTLEAETEAAHGEVGLERLAVGEGHKFATGNVDDWRIESARCARGTKQFE